MKTPTRQITKAIAIAAVTLASSIGATRAVSNLDTTTKTVSELYSAINEIDLTDYNYFIGITIGADLQTRVKQSSVCSRSESYTVQTAEFVVNKVEGVTSEGIERGYKGSDDYSHLKLMQKNTLESLKAALNGHDVSVCEESLRLAYSNGFTSTYVKVDGIPAFVSDVGYPD